MTFEAGYLIIDIQNIYNNAQGLVAKPLSDADKVTLTKFVLRNASSRVRPTGIILDGDSSNYETNYEDPFVITPSTYVYGYSSGMDLSRSTSRFQRIFTSNKTNVNDSLLSKFFYPSNVQTNGYGRSLGLPVIGPDVMGKVIVYLKPNRPFEHVHAIIPVLNRGYREVAQINNVLMAQWSV